MLWGYVQTHCWGPRGIVFGLVGYRGGGEEHPASRGSGCRGRWEYSSGFEFQCEYSEIFFNFIFKQMERLTDFGSEVCWAIPKYWGQRGVLPGRHIVSLL